MARSGVASAIVPFAKLCRALLGRRNEGVLAYVGIARDLVTGTTSTSSSTLATVSHAPQIIFLVGAMFWHGIEGEACARDVGWDRHQSKS